jgi:VWFA-related protein
MIRLTVLTFLLAAATATGQEAPATADKLPVEPLESIIRVTVQEVVAPVTVTDKHGNYVNGLEVKDFKLFDNNKLQEIKLDVSFVPISLVVAIQANASVEPVLPQIKKIGPLLEGLVVGQAGEAAIVAFDHRFQVKQDFTSDGRLFTRALEQIRPGSTTSAMIDAVFGAVRMLARRPSNHRRVLLLITETRDRGSEGRLREALLAAQVQNIIVYSVNINRAITTLLGPSQPPRWDHLPPGARPLPPGAPQTPTAQAQVFGVQGNSANFVPLFVELFRQVKSIFVDNPVEVFTTYTGGREYSFINQKTLERVISDLGEELHSQYLLSYTPNNMEEGGWHDIRVEVARYDMRVRTRPGYWMASVPR